MRLAKFVSRSLPWLICIAVLHAESPRILAPPSGKLYHGFYWGGVGTDTHDPTEHDVTPQDVTRYEEQSAPRPRGFIFQTTGSNLENFRGRCAVGSAIWAKFRTCG